ncbi:hypothetical protein MAXJ12_24032 [Mesorhizobium alhagi CCNWXJ12-2]|uniref:Uncharacterized protein n=1 Tax=Mesorhizobium alhagi CCNWXJ12-2 TaxID=1107882 RepID=H0HX87_9HYPH|nr:hypothetical protein MAXJ12_24032 [Mesorhizobium alhagi CCNWXJ12-2]
MGKVCAYRVIFVRSVKIRDIGKVAGSKQGAMVLKPAFLTPVELHTTKRQMNH